MSIYSNINNLLVKVKKECPLVHHITNYVTVNDCANVTLAIGASPVMADDVNEVKDMVSLASSLVINIGTLNSRTVASMIIAGKRANELNIPVVLDPVGVGATPYRTEIAKSIMNEVKLSVIRGNLSEIKTLYGVNSKTKGVDSSEDTGSKDELNNAKKIAVDFAKKMNTVVAITGAIDVITDGQTLYTIENGNSIMSKITGTGCMCTSLIGSYLGVKENNLLATLSGVLSMCVSGEIAFEDLKSYEGTGSFKVRLIDSIYNLSGEILEKRGKINEERC